MIYITGDTHGHFDRFRQSYLSNINIELTAKDYLIVCGDFGFLWADNWNYTYNRRLLNEFSFTVLWIQGNHENYNMIAKYPLEEWHGGAVRHIIRDKVILLEWGQVFNIEGKKFFTFGGASSHDVIGGILDKQSENYAEERRIAGQSGLPYRILNESWWAQELPTKKEMDTGLKNLKENDFKVDYVITHCASSSIQKKLEEYYYKNFYQIRRMEKDILTDYFEELEGKMQYKMWFCGHYHENIQLDEKHYILYEKIVKL